ncbi:response regulator transcription factor [Rivihabitans pingtungensis]|jgi:two-component system response regulator DctR|uniref:LuxR family two component transcriptional regulator n=1 Tax=Rivihabitans pingtungensis TaxID=1054498 RepID=A0A318KPR6_9NEIS|nr:response regulator [Rivihabitans pingtungensis]MCK6435606.1 response regulator [Rivihabitans pingtungensis]PXX78768.1 LuxR family two component transcriptional regulator [Rivihabitans pingtungensis]
MNPRSVAIVDDDEAVRDALSWLFSSKGLPTLSFASGEALLAAFDVERIGCLVLDVRMAPINGLALFEKLLASQPYCPPAIFLTGHADVPLAVSALKMGAVDFLEKPFDDVVLIERVEAALERDVSARAALASRHQLEAQLRQLTEREREVMALILDGKLNKQIAEALDISIKTVEVHRARVLEKMAVKSAVELAGRLSSLRQEP